MKRLCAALAFLTLLIGFTMVAYASEEWSYRVEDGFAYITSYRGTNRTPSVPERIGQVDVIGLCKGAVPSAVDSVRIPVAVSRFEDECIAPNVRVSAYHGAPALDWAVAQGLRSTDLSEEDYTDLVVDLTGSNYRVLSAEEYSLSDALGTTLEEGQLLYVPETDTVCQIDSIRRSDNGYIATMIEIEPMYAYNQIIIRIGQVPRGASGEVSFENGVAVAEFSNSDRRRIEVLRDVVGITGDIVLYNTEMEIRFNTKGLTGMLAMPYHVLRGEAPIIDASQPFVETVRFESDFDCNLEINHSARVPFFDNSVHEIEFGTKAFPIRRTPFSMKLFAMLQITHTDSTERMISFENGHMGFSYVGETSTWENLYQAPTVQFKQVIQNHADEIAVNFGVSFDLKKYDFVTLFEVVTGPSWRREVKSTYDKEFEGTHNCIDVVNDAVWRTQVTLTPGIDVTAMPFFKALKSPKFKFADYKYYYSNEWDLGNGIHAGVTYGMVTSAYITKEWENRRLDTTFHCNGYELANGEEAHFEMNPYGNYWRVDGCTKKHGLIMDTGIADVEPIKLDLSLCDTFNDCSQYNQMQPTRTGYTFTQWVDEDGNNFFNRSGYDPLDWEGYKTITAQWEKDSELPETIDWFIRTPSDGDIGFQTINGREVIQIPAYGNDPQTYFIERLPELLKLIQEDNYKKITLANYKSYPYYVVSGDQLGKETTNLVFGDNIIGTSGWQNCYYLKTVTCNDNMTHCGTYNNCPNLVSIKLSQSMEDVPSFNGCLSLRTITLPSSLKSICREMFGWCKSLKSLSVPESVVMIGEGAFTCSGLTSFTWPNSVDTVSRNCFRSCGSLRSIDLPKSAIKIAELAFSDCTSLENLELHASSIEDNAFTNTIGMNNLIIHGDTLTLTSKALDSGAKCVVLDVDTIEGDVNIVGSYLKSVTIRADAINGSITIKSPVLEDVQIDCRLCGDVHIDGARNTIMINNSEPMGTLTISNSSTLESLIVGDVASVDMINCYAMKDIEIGAIAGRMNFDSLYALESLVIADGTPAIPTNAFSRCYSLHTLSIPSNTTVSENAFKDDETNPEIIRRLASSITIPGGTEVYPLHFSSVYGTESNDWELAAGQVITLFAPTRSYMTFEGWYLEDDPDALMPAGIEFTMPAAETTLYARWSLSEWQLRVSDGVLESYSLPEGITALELTDEVSTIPAGVLDAKITSIYISKTVSEIDEQAFVYALHLRDIEIDSRNANFFVYDNALYSKDGTLLAVPRDREDNTLSLWEGCKVVSGYAFGGYSSTDNPCNLNTVFLSDDVQSLGEHWWRCLPDSCAFYGNETGAVADEIILRGFSYNEYPILFFSEGEMVGFYMGQQGDEVPALQLESPGMIFCGWSTTQGGEILPEPVVIPKGGTPLHAIWSDGSSSNTSIKLKLDDNKVLIGGDLPFSVDASGAEALRVIALLPDGSLDGEWTFEGDHGEGTVWWWSLDDHTVYAQAKYNGVWSLTSQSYTVKTLCYGALPQPTLELSPVAWAGEPIEFSFEGVEGEGWNSLELIDAETGDWILGGDYSASGTYTLDVSKLNEGKIYTVWVSSWQTGYQAAGSEEKSFAVVNRNKVMTLPEKLTTIEEEAFAGINTQLVIVPNGTTTIDARAFADSPNLIAVVLPDSVANVSDDAFDGCNEHLVIANSID